MHWIELKAEDKIMIQHQELNSGRKDKGFIARAQGCLLGQLAGDALGSLVEFQSPEEIKLLYPNGIHELADGGTWNTIAGQQPMTQRWLSCWLECWSVWANMILMKLETTFIGYSQNPLIAENCIERVKRISQS